VNASCAHPGHVQRRARRPLRRVGVGIGRDRDAHRGRRAARRQAKAVERAPELVERDRQARERGREVRERDVHPETRGIARGADGDLAGTAQLHRGAGARDHRDEAREVTRLRRAHEVERRVERHGEAEQGRRRLAGADLARGGRLRGAQARPPSIDAFARSPGGRVSVRSFGESPLLGANVRSIPRFAVDPAWVPALWSSATVGLIEAAAAGATVAVAAPTARIARTRRTIACTWSLPRSR
jgi:hypothetical protein